MINPTREVEILTHNGSSLEIFRDAPSWKERKTAAFGRLNITCAKNGAALLQEAVETLSRDEYEAIIGPMDGDTWHSYRTVVESDGSPAFLMEPSSGPHDLNAIKAAGFAPIEYYVSMKVATEKAIAQEPDNPEELEIEPWDGQSPETFFGEVYDFSVEGFSRNAFYKPITREAFLGLYMPYVSFLKRELIFFARTQDGALAGFLFGVPDYAQGPETKTAILKSYASSVRGAGHLLADAFHRTARAMGFDTCIHALMHIDNVSAARSAMHGAEVFRKYALFGMEL